MLVTLKFRQWVFLDFDGVTHPYFPDTEAPHFVFLPAIEAVLRRHPTCGVVISSSWREKYALAELQQKFSADFRERVVGMTPSIPIPFGHTERGERQREVEAWLAANGQDEAAWVAIDDCPFLYLPGAAVVATPDRFGDREASLLDAALTNPKAFAGNYPVPRVLA